ncbi:GDSL-type esterase/lipase family protein [Paenibacillus sp. sgz500958]|uniref:GDSL-type esterase/lipase family protein n=1 Tax=Paenibacillus sp. sgz500958 TaxID=3242475 RepID=UPI0036D40779
MGYQYTAIGDSLTTGFGALPGNGFVPVYRRMAESRLRTPISLVNLGINGLTSAELSQRVRRNDMFRGALKEAELITISIGGNDLIHAARSASRQPQNTSRILGEALQECRHNFSVIMGTVSGLKSGSREPYIVRIVGLYNPFPEFREATNWVQQFNRYASQYNSGTTGFAGIYSSFAGHERTLLSLDHLHPNGRGYQVIANQLNALGYGRLY